MYIKIMDEAEWFYGPVFRVAVHPTEAYSGSAIEQACPDTILLDADACEARGRNELVCARLITFRNEHGGEWSVLTSKHVYLLNNSGQTIESYPAGDR